MKNSKVIQMVNKEDEAKRLFSGHVQSIAFNLTLSRNMIEALQAARDWGFPNIGGGRPSPWNTLGRSTNGACQFYKMMEGLLRRGLIIRHAPDLNKDGHQIWNGKKLIVLSKAGELVCDLLVEAGLLPAKQPEKKARKKS